MPSRMIDPEEVVDGPTKEFDLATNRALKGLFSALRRDLAREYAESRVARSERPGARAALVALLSTQLEAENTFVVDAWSELAALLGVPYVDWDGQHGPPPVLLGTEYRMTAQPGIVVSTQLVIDTSDEDKITVKVRYVAGARH